MCQHTLPLLSISHALLWESAITALEVRTEWLSPISSSSFALALNSTSSRSRLRRSRGCKNEALFLMPCG